MSDKNQFDGDGFKEGPLDGKEAAKHRHMFHEIDRNWVKIDSDVLDTITDAAVVASAMRVLSGMVRIGTPLGVAGLAFGAFAKSQGWI